MKYRLRTCLLSLLFYSFWMHPAVAFPPSHGLSLYGPEGLKYGVTDSYDFANPRAPKGGELYLSSMGFTKLNPLSLKGIPAPGLMGLIFETPMDSSSDDEEPFSQYGHLVKSAELADDRMSMVYNIHPDARFSDGHPVTADDFVFSWELIQNPEYHPFFKQYFKDIKSVEKLDKLKVKYTFTIFNQELPLITGQMTILPRHIYGQKGKTFGSDFDESAIGSGPYLVEKYEFGKYITLKRNPKWWGLDRPRNQGRYNFDRITWRVYTDPIAIREGFKGGSLDALPISSSRDWALDYKGSFVEKKYYLKEKLPHKRVSGMQGFAMNLRNPIFQSRKVRAAMALVLDFDWMNQNLFYNQYTRQECYFDNNPEMKPQGPPTGSVLEILNRLKRKYPGAIPKTALTKPVGAPGQGQPLEKNLALANRLLESAGWVRGPDGMRQKGESKLAVEMLLDNPQWHRIVEPYQNNLKKIGVEMKVTLVQPAQYEERMRDFKFDMVVQGYGQSRSPGNEQRDLWSTAAAKTPGSRNVIGIQNPAVDELIELVIAAKTRKALVEAIQALDRVLTHQFYMVPHWFIPYDRVVYWNRFSRPSVYASQSQFLDNMIEWWWWDRDKESKLKEARKKGVALP